MQNFCSSYGLRVCVDPDGRTDGHGYLNSSRRADQEYIYFIWSEMLTSMRCTLLTKINIPFLQGYKNGGARNLNTDYRSNYLSCEDH